MKCNFAIVSFYLHVSEYFYLLLILILYFANWRVFATNNMITIEIFKSTFWHDIENI